MMVLEMQGATPAPGLKHYGAIFFWVEKASERNQFSNANYINSNEHLKRGTFDIHVSCF